MPTDVRARPALTSDEMVKLSGGGDEPGRRLWPTFALAAAALILALAGAVSVTRVDGSEDALVQAGPAASSSPVAAVRGVTETAPPVPDAPATTPATTVPSVPTTAAATPVITAAATPTIDPAPAPPTTVAACRNSTEPACGPFRFDPQPGADSPITVHVVAQPASPRVGQPVVFRVTLSDPDGVSHGSSVFTFGDSGIGETSPSGPCKRHGPWDPPARDPAHATESQDIGHTYAQAGTYTATFSFEAGPYECVDSESGRGDRPYATSGTGTVTIVVRP